MNTFLEPSWESSLGAAGCGGCFEVVPKCSSSKKLLYNASCFGGHCKGTGTTAWVAFMLISEETPPAGTGANDGEENS